ncbi:sulfite exporter TauE/SafE family protein [Consotaella aegiceratis]|uniref:sulfite exporter TauE/SafE family protein n=1 Tax=Consotaella aegiceratis TaxID=3097961 RepID=UPI002F42A1F3
MIITDPYFYLCAIPAVILVGLAKGGFGGSMGIVGVPLMALAISPVTAAGILLPILVFMDWIGLFAWRGTFDRRVLVTMLPAALVGVAVGYTTAALIPETGVELVIGLLAVWFVLEWFFVLRHRTEEKPQSTPRGMFWGAITGFTSFVGHAGGPPFQVYVLPLRLAPTLFVGTSVILFTTINASKLLPYYLLGQLSTENLLTSAVLLPLALVATLAGVWLVKRIDPKRFYALTYSLLILVGLKLAYDGAAGLGLW